MILNVSGSGIATMSDSSIALKPVIEDPSKPIPSSSAPSISLGVIAKLFRCPSRSVNQKRTYSTPSSRICARTRRRASGSDVALCLLSIIAMRPFLPEPESQENEKAPGRRSGAPEASSPRKTVGVYKMGFVGKGERMRILLVDDDERF